MPRPRPSLCLLALLAAPPAAQDPVTLERIFADPDWIATSPERPFWGDDGRTVYFWRDRAGTPLEDLWRVDGEGGEPERVPPGELAEVALPGGDWSADRRTYVWEREGDLYLRERGGAVRQLTRTAARESDPRFLAGDARVLFRRGDELFVFERDGGLVWQPVDLRAEDDPHEDDEDFDYLTAKQERLYRALAERRADEEAQREHERAVREADPGRAPAPWYLGDGVELVRQSLSPDARWLLVVTQPEGERGERGTLPSYVTESGYVETRPVRRRVGRDDAAGHGLLLLDLATRERHELDLAALPGAKEDPLARIREEAVEWHVARGAEREDAEKAVEAPEVRPVRVQAIAWADTGARALVRLDSVDNKDRWLAALVLDASGATDGGEAEPGGDEGRAEEKDEAAPALAVQHRLTDPAWINFRFNEHGWLPGGEALWYVSEERGHGQLWAKALDDEAPRRLTRGAFTVRAPELGPDGAHLYYTANADHTGIYDAYRVAVATGEVERLTELGGYNELRVAPDGRRLLLEHSGSVRPPDLWVQEAVPGAEPRRLTRTVTAEFASLPWVEPELVDVPSSHADQPIRARLFLPDGFDPSRRWPAVVFVHGAGYTQEAYAGWSYYFRELLFHTFLTRHGYVVLAPDYRGSAGYGRDWRTAVYRRMGHPEVEDLRDCVDWLVERRSVDRGRVGVYGGSYGGFLTFMALFRDPELFAVGAALRPVTDWAHYNHRYTSNILNTPVVDPMAYEQSSPIEFADGLSRPVLICAGMQDDNVFFQDTVLLVQRLIELGKEDFETAFYPLEPHSFEHPESWLDEYRRIFATFERWLK